MKIFHLDRRPGSETKGSGSGGSAWGRSLATFATLNFVVLAWIPFRATSVENAIEVLQRIASRTVSFDNISLGLWVVLAVAAIAHCTPKKWYEFTLKRFEAVPFYAQAALLALLVIAIEYVAITGAAPFLYTQF